MEANKEIWKSGIKGTVGVLKMNFRGDLVTEIVGADQKLVLSTEERIINQEKAANEALDPFKNGMLIPVRLFDAEDATEIASNPNLMAESEMEALFKANWKTFDARIAQISNSTALHRLLDIAEQQDATVRQVNSIQSRIDAVSEKAVITPDGSELNDEMRQFRPVTPL